MRVASVARWLTFALLAAAPAAGQAPDPALGAAFRPLLADPQEPPVFAAYLWGRSPRLAPRLGSVGFGQTIGVVNGRTWQLAIAAAVFSQFNLARPTADLMNTEYRAGPPLTYPHAGEPHTYIPPRPRPPPPPPPPPPALMPREQLYHQSSHLGDEYMVYAN